MQKVTVETTVNAPLAHVWACFTKPEHIMAWNFASDDWECPRATNDLRVGGSFSYTMSAKDKSMSFDFGGTYTKVEPGKAIEFALGDVRQVSLAFSETPGGVRVTETFDSEDQNPVEMQRAGWQAILDNFKKHAERAR